MKYILIALVSLIGLTSCEEVIDLKLEGEDSPRTIIEAQVVNREGFSFVRLSQSIDFYTPTAPPAISGAVVTVSDELGNTQIFLEDSLGTYLPQDSTFKGEIGGVYHLKVEANEQVFESSSTLFPVIEIDSIVVHYRENIPFQDDGYYVGFYAKEPQDQDNWYLWKVAKNGEYYTDLEDLMFADDQIVKENIENLELPFVFELGDTVLFEQYSISEEVFDYYNQLQELYFNDGGLFSPPPVNPQSNIEGGALGIFITSAMVSEVIIIE